MPAKTRKKHSKEELGNCYQWAAETLLLSDGKWRDMLPKAATDIRLVHGWPTLTRPPYEKYGHAWLEFRHGILLVMDGQLGSLWPMSMYYYADKIKAVDCRKYTSQEAAQKILEFQHYGPWE